MTVRPNEIVADSVSVEGTNKTIDVNVNGSDAEVQTTPAGVALNSGNDTATARELKLENNTVKVGNSTIRILPSRVIEIIKVSPKAMEIIEENNMVIYKVKADEDRKLLGIFVVKMEKQIDVDGSQGNIISESSPWWAILTTAAK
jgi:coenzyme F420-reducing hydrogenase alpha subunit